MAVDAGASLEGLTPTAAGGHEAPSPEPEQALDPSDIQEIEAKVVPEPRPGERMIPAVALREERGKLKAAKKEAAALKAQLAQMTPIVEQFKTLEPMLPQIAVWAEAAAKGQTPVQPQGASDPELAAIAAELGTSEEVAGKLLRVMTKVAGNVTGQAFAPVAREVATLRSGEVLQTLKNVKDERTGQPYADPGILDRVFGAIVNSDPKLAANPEVAKIALVIARGLDPRATEPTLSEGTGSRLPGMQGMTEIDRRIAESRGISMEKWGKLKSNDSLVLED